MPQVVEVLKYVHEIVEEQTLGVAIGVDVQANELRYKELYGSVRGQFDILLVELRKMRTQNPGLKVQIDMIEAYIIELDKIIQFPRFIEVEKEKIVEKEVNKAVLVPTKDSTTVRNELALTLLVEKLVGEITRIKKTNPNVALSFDDDFGLIFFGELYGNANFGGDFNTNLKSYKDGQWAKLKSIGSNWTGDHELMINTILEERFTMANMIKQANLEIEKTKAISD